MINAQAPRDTRGRAAKETIEMRERLNVVYRNGAEYRKHLKRG